MTELTQTRRVDNLTAEQVKVWTYLQSFAWGRANAKKGREVAAAVGFKDNHEATHTRSIITDLQDLGFPIASNTVRGFWAVPSTEADDLNKTAENRERRAEKMKATAECLRKTAADLARLN